MAVGTSAIDSGSGDSPAQARQQLLDNFKIPRPLEIF